MAANQIVAPHYVPNITLPVDPPAFLGPWIYLALLGDAERSLFHRRYPAIRTRQQEQALPRISIYNFRIPPVDGVAASLRHLETVHLWQAHGYKLNASIGAIMAHKVSGRTHYFHPSANNWLWNGSRTLGHCRTWWTDHAAGLMPDSAWHVLCITDVEFYVDHNMAAPIQGPTDLSDDDDESDGDDVAGPDGDEDANSVHLVRGLAVPELNGWIWAVHSYKNRLCVFKCMAWLDGHRTRIALMRGSLYYFHQWWISREGFREFLSLTMDYGPGISGDHVFNRLPGIHAGWQWGQLSISATASSPSPGHGPHRKCTSGGGPALPPHWGPPNVC